jgi:hypothetical protein
LDDPVVHYTDEDGQVKERILPENSDLRIQYRDGYTELCETGAPSMRLIRLLWLTDSRRIGKDFVRQKAAEWDAQEDARRKKRLSSFEDLAGETYEKMAWRTGRRMATNFKSEGAF